MNFRSPKQSARRDRVELDLSDTVVYAVGDVHGCYQELASLEHKIVADAATLPGRKLIIMLGDYIDRGPDSARVLDHLIAPPPAGFERICLTGNHEAQTIDYLDGRLSLERWLSTGARSTLFSYGIDAEHLGELYGSDGKLDEHIRATIPRDHIDFIRALPIMAYSERFVFVHAGIRPGVPLLEQKDDDLIYIRQEFFEASRRLDRWVVHGHTPVDHPRIDGRRLDIDTGAFKTGRLTAVRIAGKGGRLLFS
ncbi:serine/threonine protein phosphatase [Aminobacter carboxidus]|uniref:Serine/threonine protein phosphatase n=1 Tax=Aminobacter carboxidus TaxID=376165 RepID=A0ABR9GLY8_9HYPH|nr:metallophosphoesterase family protein [Aminobacter carboxidus]MBE1204589.1 serine/threonine protein phosphatase [Aminobacter carboxidus]